jgi:diacylglycerol O-acyltransferase/trehalose O-mycolyltransferase
MSASRFALIGALLLGLTVNSGQALAGRRSAPMTCKGTARLRTCAVTLPPGVTVHSNKVQVLVPADYDTHPGKYPVVFVLHGVGDDYTSWTSARGELGSLTTSCEAIFVMPDGGSHASAGWYSDWKDGTYQYETFHTSVLPKAVDAVFRTEGPRYRAIAGLSMGGFGALSYTARHPGMYQATASYSGFVDTLFGAPASGTAYEYAGQDAATNEGTPSSRIWGDQSADRAVWAAHNPYDLVAALKGQPLYLSSGHGVPAGGSQGDDLHKGSAYASEAYIGQLNDRLASRLTSEGIAFTDGREYGGRHDWPYWRATFTASLKVLMPALNAATAGCGA